MTRWYRVPTAGFTTVRHKPSEVARTGNATGGLLAPGFISARLNQMVRNLKQDPEWGRVPQT